MDVRATLSISGRYVVCDKALMALVNVYKFIGIVVLKCYAQNQMYQRALECRWHIQWMLENWDIVSYTVSQNLATYNCNTIQ
jgi:hypothetical protein